MVGDRRGDLQPDRRAEPAPGQLPLQRLEQVLVAVLVDLHLGVAGDPEQVALDHLHAGEQLPEVGGDQLLDRQEPHARLSRSDRDEPGHVVGHLDPGEQLRRRRPGRAPTTARFSDRLGDVRERVRRVDGERGEHREDLLPEVGAQPLPLARRPGRPSAPAAMPSAASFGQDLVDEAGGVPGDQVGGPLGDQLELGAQRAAGRRRAPAGRPGGGASGRRPAPCRTRRGCWRRSPGTWPAPAAGSPGPRRAPAPGR